MDDFILQHTGEVVNDGITQAIKSQEKLISGENIKTINNESILGAGNIDIQGGGVTPQDVDDSIQTHNTNEQSHPFILQKIEKLENLGTFIGAFETRAQVPNNVSAFTSHVQVGDFVYVHKDETNSDQTTVWAILNINNGVITWKFIKVVTIDMTGKMDMQPSATAGNLVEFDNFGNSKDSGQSSNMITILASTKMDKQSGAKTGNFAKFMPGGNVADSGYNADDFKGSVGKVYRSNEVTLITDATNARHFVSINDIVFDSVITENIAQGRFWNEGIQVSFIMPTGYVAGYTCYFGVNPKPIEDMQNYNVGDNDGEYAMLYNASSIIGQSLEQRKILIAGVKYDVGFVRENGGWQTQIVRQTWDEVLNKPTDFTTGDFLSTKTFTGTWVSGTYNISIDGITQLDQLTGKKLFVHFNYTNTSQIPMFQVNGLGEVPLNYRPGVNPYYGDIATDSIHIIQMIGLPSRAAQILNVLDDPFAARSTYQKVFKEPEVDVQHMTVDGENVSLYTVTHHDFQKEIDINISNGDDINRGMSTKLAIPSVMPGYTPYLVLRGETPLTAPPLTVVRDPVTNEINSIGDFKKIVDIHPDPLPPQAGGIVGDESVRRYSLVEGRAYIFAYSNRFHAFQTDVTPNSGIEEAPKDGWDYMRGDESWQKWMRRAGKYWIPFPSPLFDMSCVAFDGNTFACIGSTQGISPSDNYLIYGDFSNPQQLPLGVGTWTDLCAIGWGSYLGVQFTGQLAPTPSISIFDIWDTGNEIKTIQIQHPVGVGFKCSHYATDFMRGVYEVCIGGDNGKIFSNAGDIYNTQDWVLQPHNLPGSAPLPSITDITYGNGVWIAVCSTGEILRRTYDSNTWTMVAQFAKGMKKVQYCPSTQEFIALCTASPSGDGTDILCVAPADGLTWSVQKALSGYWVDIEATPSMTVIIGSDGRIISSSDRVKWIERENPINMPLTAITHVTQGQQYAQVSFNTIQQRVPITAFVAVGKGVDNSSILVSITEYVDSIIHQDIPK